MKFDTKCSGMKKIFRINLLILIGILLLNGILTKKKKSQSKNHQAPQPPYYVPFARLAYCPRPVLTDMNCSFCTTFKEYNTFYVHTIEEGPGIQYQFIINISDLKHEVVISFSGPKAENGQFFTGLYMNGFNAVPELGANIESEYWRIYNLAFRGMLFSKVEEIKKSTRAGYRFIFVGHSFGGSIAVLAAYDLVKAKTLLRHEATGSPIVYTFGQLRIGDENFVAMVNKAISVVKVIRQNDYLTRIPNCVFEAGVYRCYPNPNAVVSRFPTLRNYFTNYFSSAPTPAAVRSVVPPPVRAVGPLPVSSVAVTNPIPADGIFRFKSIKSNKKKRNSNKGIVRGTTFVGNTLVQTHVPTEPVVIPGRGIVHAALTPPMPAPGVVPTHPIPAPRVLPATPVVGQVLPQPPLLGGVAIEPVRWVTPLYSQPFGLEYFGNSMVNRYNTCNYVNGVPICEKRVTLPPTFTPMTHKMYYQTNIELC